MSLRPSIKICGITRPSDARIISNLGADYAGLIFYRRSPRYVRALRAKEILRAAELTMNFVGVFVDDNVKEILTVCRKLRINIAQLHGSYTKSDVNYLKRSGLIVIQAFHPQKRSDWAAINSSSADFALVDNQTGDRHGGTGKKFDWSSAPKRLPKNLILSGGLNAENFAEGIKRFNPLILDFNSGVESAPGEKSKRKLEILFRRYREHLSRPAPRKIGRR